MNYKKTKRSVLDLVTVCISLCCVLGCVFPVSSDEPIKKNVSKKLVIGPFRLGEIYKNMDSKENRELIQNGGGPSTKAIVKALNACELYIIDEKELIGNDWKFSFLTGSNLPKVHAKGKNTFRLQDNNGKDFDIKLNKLDTFGWGTKAGIGVIQAHSQIRTLRLAIYLETDWILLGNSEDGFRGKNLTFFSVVGYNPSGKRWYVVENNSQK